MLFCGAARAIETNCWRCGPRVTRSGTTTEALGPGGPCTAREALPFYRLLPVRQRVRGEPRGVVAERSKEPREDPSRPGELAVSGSAAFLGAGRQRASLRSRRVFWCG